jgi:hypothetical protein
MLISERQQEANRNNAQKSTGPKTQEGKEAIRFNALTFGLRTKATILESENAAEYSQLWDELDAEWQPQTRTERLYLETMVTSQWLLKRVAESEQKIYLLIKFGGEQFKMLASAAKRREQLERSFRTAVADMKQSQKERKAQPHPQLAQTSPQPPAPNPGERSAPSPGERSAPTYVMAGAAEPQPLSCTPDTR